MTLAGFSHRLSHIVAIVGDMVRGAGSLIYYSHTFHFYFSGLSFIMEGPNNQAMPGGGKNQENTENHATPPEPAVASVVGNPADTKKRKAEDDAVRMMSSKRGKKDSDADVPIPHFFKVNWKVCLSITLP
jgi:hypothetical protein